ncbi:MAG: PriCT-2 domain-containing protein [Gemmatimonadales bacterium]
MGRSTLRAKGGNVSPTDHALTAAAIGRRVIPVNADKVPLVKNWPALATSDPDQIRRWARQFPGCSWGYQPGLSGLLVADIDSHRAEVIATDMGLLAEPTRTIATGRRHYPSTHPKHFARSAHLLFRAPTPVPFGKIKHLGHLEIFGATGFCLLEGSRHGPTGSDYAVELDLEPLPFPARALSILLQSRRPAQPPRLPTTTDAARALECLGRLDPARSDDYGDWLAVGMAVHHATAGSAEGLDAWREWSRQSHKYRDDRDECGDKWISFGDATGSPITLGSLVAWSRADAITREAARADRLRREYVAA